MASAEQHTRQVRLRSRWQNEALDFTPWLAKNLHLLGDALCMKLEFAQREAPAGPFSLDLLARDSNTGAIVAIENQYDATDHSHLGQVLTYAAELDANVVIWIAEYFVNSHRKALHYLNEWTPDKLKFYCIEVKLTKTGDSFDAPTFHKVVWPGDWERTVELTSRPRTPLGEKVFDVSRPLVIRMYRAGFDPYDTQYAPNGSGIYPMGRELHSIFRINKGYKVNVGYIFGWNCWEEREFVGIFICGDSPSTFDRVFGALKEKQRQVEESIGDKCYWLPGIGKLDGDITISRPGCSLDDPPEKQEETLNWMYENLLVFRDVFDPLVEKILNEMPDEPTDA